MSASSIVHRTFVVERTYPVRAARVFAAFSNPATKRRWFADGEGWQIDEFNADFRVGGRETSRFRFKDGPAVANDTVYQDIVPDKRIVFVYAMTVGDKRISASLASVELLRPAAALVSSTPSRGSSSTASTSPSSARLAAPSSSTSWAKS